MRNVLPSLTLALLVAVAGLAPTMASATETQTDVDVTFRSAPVGFVVPSVFIVNTEATWIVDPAEDERFNEHPGIAGCEISVADDNGNGAVDGTDALNRAEETGCITGWSGRSDESCTDGSPVFVAEVDGLEEVFPATFWMIQRNGQLTPGVCDIALQDGDEISFVYE